MGRVRINGKLEPAYMVDGYKIFWHIWSILGWPQYVSAILPYNRLLGQPAYVVNCSWTKRTRVTYARLTCPSLTSDVHTLALPAGPPAEGGLRASPELGPVHRRHHGDKEDGGEDERAGVHLGAHSLYSFT